MQGQGCKDDGSAKGRCVRSGVQGPVCKDGHAKVGVQEQGCKDGSAKGRCARLGVQGHVCMVGCARVGVQR